MLMGREISMQPTGGDRNEAIFLIETEQKKGEKKAKLEEHFLIHAKSRRKPEIKEGEGELDPKVCSCWQGRIKRQ